MFSIKRRMQPPHSADLPSARYTLTGVITVCGSAARIHSMASRISRSVMCEQEQTIILRLFGQASR